MHPYKITPSSIPAERMVTFEPEATLSDIQRGAGLAKALSARSTRDPVGWTMTPSRMDKWVLLFDAGFEAYTLPFDPLIRYRRTPGERIRLYDALKVAKAMKAGHEYFSRLKVEVSNPATLTHQ